MTPIKLTPTQTLILTQALDHTGGRIDWFPDKIQGGARKKVLEGLRGRGLAHQEDGAWCVTPAGYVALGRPEPTPANQDSTPEPEATQGADGATVAAEPDVHRPRIRDNTKQATVIGMLRRPEGATLAQICDATGWQAHSARGLLAGALKKKLGLTLVSEKVQGGERVYHLSA